MKCPYCKKEIRKEDNKNMILEIVSNEYLSISEISREVGISYSNAHRQVHELLNANLLTKKHLIKEKNQPLLVKTKC